MLSWKTKEAPQRAMKCEENAGAAGEEELRVEARVKEEEGENKSGEVRERLGTAGEEGDGVDLGNRQGGSEAGIGGGEEVGECNESVGLGDNLRDLSAELIKEMIGGSLNGRQLEARLRCLKAVAERQSAVVQELKSANACLLETLEGAKAENAELRTKLMVLEAQLLDSEQERGFFIDDAVVKRVEEENVRLKELCERYYGEVVPAWFEKAMGELRKEDGSQMQ